MKLKSFGCSFIFGTDLADDGRNGPYATGSRLTWPALIAQHHGWEYQTFARPGAGNLQILERLLNQIDTDDPAVYVIGWTYINRFDYVDDSLSTPWPGTKWKTLMPIDTDSVADSYYRNLHAEYSDKLRSQIYIKTAIDCLTRHSCKFIMTYIDALVTCRQWHTTKGSTGILDQIEPYLSDFAGKSFVEWSQTQGFPISPVNHPLEQAHCAAAKLVLDNWAHHIKH